MQQFGSHNMYNWTHQHLIEVLTTGKNPILKDPLIINAFKHVKREDFVPEEQRAQAYADQPLDIGHDQSISQPTVVAKMLSLLRPREGKRFLDIGSGSGYSSALLGFIAGNSGKVFSLERNQYLSDLARQNISKYPDLMGRVELFFKDGSKGYSEKAPFDFIHAAAAFDQISQNLKNQLTIGGRMVAPTKQDDIHVIERISPTDFDERIEEGYIFVPVIEGIE